MLTVENRLGRIEFSEEFIRNLVKEVVLNCYGVSALSSETNKNFLHKFIKISSRQDGIIIKKSSFTVKIEVHIKLAAGLNVSETVRSIKNKVGWAIKDTIGIFADEINVIVDNVKESRG